MIYKETLPHPALLSYIRCYYYSHVSPDKGNDNSFRFPTDGGAELVFNIKNYVELGFSSDKLKQESGARLIGPYGQSLFTNADEENITLAVRFHPGQMAPFFAIPASEIRDSVICLSDIWGETGRRFEESIHSAKSFTEMVQLLDNLFLKCISNYESGIAKVDNALTLISNSQGQLTVEDIAERMNIGRRQLERLFFTHVGITPKRLSRIKRFRSVLSHLQNSSHYRWCDIAAQWGYSDQAHMIQEFNFFTGTSPEVCLKNLSIFDQMISNQ